LNDFIYLDGKIFTFIDRKCSDIKQFSSPTRSLNGTLCLDILSSTCKKEWGFSFECDDRGLLRLRNLWGLNSSYTMVDWDSVSYTVACTSQNFDESFVGQDGDTYWFNVSLEFKQI